MSKVTPEQIDDLLPQTQCGLCTHGGCMPYAEAIVFEKAPINLCPPGGVETLVALAQLLNEDASSFIDEMQQKAKPPLLAAIREHECIGCTKCIQVCPVDAILGSAKQMHTVIASECTGCELCIPACPVDCIDLIKGLPITREKANAARTRFNNREKRIKKERDIKSIRLTQQSLSQKRNYIQEAIERAKARKIKP